MSGIGRRVLKIIIITTVLFWIISNSFFIEMPISFAEDDYTLNLFEDRTFTSFNFHNDSYFPDQNNPSGMPSASTFGRGSSGNSAYAFFEPDPNYAYIMFSEIGVRLNLDSSGYNWDEIKNAPVKVTFDFTYAIESYGSSNAILSSPSYTLDSISGYIPGVTCFDGMGTVTNESGTRNGHIVQTFTTNHAGKNLTIENMLTQISVAIVCQAFNNDNGSSVHRSSANVTLNSIKIEFPVKPPVASFVYSRAAPSSLNKVDFDASISNVINSSVKDYYWDFGDGSTFNGNSPVTSHQYTNPGQYTVLLTITDSNGLKNSTVKNIRVESTIAPSTQPVILNDNLYIDATDWDGVKYIATSNGTYRFTIISGAYESVDRALYPDHPEWLGYRNLLLVYKNRPVEWVQNGTTEYGDPVEFPLNNDNLLGVLRYDYASYAEAEAAGIGQYIDIPMSAGDYVLLICPDARNVMPGGGYSYSYYDNEGGMTVSVKTVDIVTPPVIIPENTVPVVGAVLVGVGVSIFSVLLGNLISWLSPYFDKIIEFLLGGIKSFIQRYISVKESRIRKVTAAIRKPIFIGLSPLEITVGVFCAIFLGIVFAYAKGKLFVPDILLMVIVVSGVTAVAHELAHRYFSKRYGIGAEYKFWDIGTLSLIVTTILFSTPFGQPARNIINRSGSMDVRKQGMISLAGPIASLLLSIIFLVLFILKIGPASLGSEGFKISMLACVYSLMPFEPMEGKIVMTWNKWLWALVFIPSLIFYLVMLIQVFK